MAFPVREATATTGETTTSTSHVLNLPASVAGRLLIADCAVVSTGNIPSVPSGWTDLGSYSQGASPGLSGRFLAKIDSGSESAPTLTTAGAVKMAAIVHSISGHGGLAGIYKTAVDQGFGTQVNHPNLAPGIGAKDFLWVSLVGDEHNIGVGTWPANYTYHQLMAGTGGAGSNVGVATSMRQLNAASEDPNPYVLNGAADFGDIFLAVSPAEDIMVSQSPAVLALASPAQVLARDIGTAQDPAKLSISVPVQSIDIRVARQVPVVGGNLHTPDWVPKAGGGLAVPYLMDQAGDKPAWDDAATRFSAAAHAHDHGTLTGLADDDHPQYATNTEFDDHSARHESGGADAVKLDDLATPDDNTDLNASTVRHGLLQKLPGGTTTFLRADGTFAAAGASITVDEEDGSPSVSGVDKLTFPAGTVTDLGSGDVKIREVPTGVVTAHVENNVAQTVATGAWTKMAFNAAVKDTDSMFSDANDRLTVAAGLGGPYCIYATSGWDFNGTGRRYIALYKNGAQAESVRFDAGDTATNGRGPNILLVLDLVAGDYIECFIYQDSGGNLNTSAGGNRLMMFKLGSGIAGDAIGCRLSKTANQSVNSATETAVTWDSEQKDTDGFHDNVTNNHRITIPAGLAGDYIAIVALDWAGSTGGVRRGFATYKNGAIVGEVIDSENQDAATPLRQEHVVPLQGLVAGDYIEFKAYHDAGVALNVQSGYASWVYFYRVGAVSQRGYKEGTAFPVGAVSGDKFYRTNIRGGMLFRFDGTRWLSDQQFVVPIGSVAAPINVDTTLAYMSMPTDYDAWLETLWAQTYKASGTAGNYFDFQLRKFNAANSYTNIVTFNTNSDSNSVWTAHTQTINAEFDKDTHVGINLYADEIGTAGDHYFGPFQLAYRLIAT